MKKIVLKEDKSYLSEIDSQAIAKGVAELGIHAIRLERDFTEKQKQENRELADKLSKEEWIKHCKEKKSEIGEKIERVVDIISGNFMIYQYKNKNINFSNDNWDFFFWCNNGDLSYVRLNPNENRANEQQIKDIEKVIELIKTIDCEGVSLTIQYTVQYNNRKVEELVNQAYNSIKDSFIEYMGVEGRIKEVGKSLEGETVYGFFKKRARSKYRIVRKSWFLEKMFEKMSEQNTESKESLRW